MQSLFTCVIIKTVKRYLTQHNKGAITMTLEMITKKLDTIAQDTDYIVLGNTIHLTVEDFAGFDEDFEEIERELIDEIAVMQVLDWLEEQADKIEGHYYKDYLLGEYIVKLGYASMDI